MTIRSILACMVGLALSTPAAATVVSWRATGTVSHSQGNISLLPLSGTAGDDFAIEFSYDDAATDTDPANPDSGRYPILSLVVEVATSSMTFVDDVSGSGEIHIQANSISSNLWGVSGCLPCGDSHDEGRLNLFFPADAILSDALTPPPDPTGATVQFLLFSREPGDEAFLVASLESIAPVPEPAGGTSLLTAFAVLAGLGSASRIRVT